MFGCRFSWGDHWWRTSISLLHSRNAIRFPLDTVIPVHILLCKLLPTCLLKFPSIFWIRLVLASSLQAHSAKPQQAAERLPSVHGFSLHPSGTGWFISSSGSVCVLNRTPLVVLLVGFHTPTVFCLFGYGAYNQNALAAS